MLSLVNKKLVGTFQLFVWFTMQTFHVFLHQSLFGLGIQKARITVKIHRPDRQTKKVPTPT